VQKPHPPFLVGAQSEESLCWATQYDNPFAQIDSMVEQARRAGASGLGGSDDQPWIRSMADLAMFYLDLIERAGLDRIHLIGNSLGGWLAAEIFDAAVLRRGRRSRPRALR
jgi:hypothetical protein